MWYSTASEKNYQPAIEQLPQAQFNLGLMYAKGQGVKKDLKEAVNWYKKAAERNLAKAQFYLGWMYENGLGVKKDLTEAIKWYRKAAEQGYEPAKALLKNILQKNNPKE